MKRPEFHKSINTFLDGTAMIDEISDDEVFEDEVFNIRFTIIISKILITTLNFSKS
jgi:hypothetical protein